MLASDSQLMPDPADKGRPSSPPLSVEDADRLADSFTAFWDDAPAPPPARPVSVLPPVAILAPVSAPPPPVAAPSSIPAPAPVAADARHPGTVTAPMPAVQAIPQPKPLGKQTLLGIAPINIEKPARSEPAHSAPIQSSPEVPGYAIAYTPKDPPSTPAVVIAPEAQSSPENLPPENKRQFSQTVPSRVRSAPNASLSPIAPPTRVAPAPAADDFNPYAPRKGKGKLIGLVLAGALLLLVSVVGVRSFSGGSHEPSTAAALANDVVQTVTTGAAAPTPSPSEPAEPAAAISTPTPAVTGPELGLAPRSKSERAPVKAKAKVKAEPAAPAARPASRAPAADPSPTPSKPAGKGVIVRDAPF